MFESSIWVTYPKRKSSVTFKKDFILKKNIKSAFISITSMGWYHLFINKIRVDKDVFCPGWTEYEKRVQYQEYDITDLIRDNKISLSCDLAEGWGGGDHFALAKERFFLYYQMSLIFEIKVNYSDGSKEILNSDESLDCYSNQFINTTIYGGETQDVFAPIEYLGKAKHIDINTKIIPQEGEPIIETERIKPVKMFKDNNGDLLIDFGQNFTGYIEINIKGNKLDKISYTPCEVLDKNGNFYNLNYRSAKSFYSFVLTGEQETLKPRFSFMGGRYIKLIDYPEYITKDNFIGVLVSSKLNKTFDFECGNELVNKLYKNIIYGQLSNYLDVPTDCPQRDERLGWTADAQIFAATAAVNFDVSRFMNKYINDLKVSQFKDGGINGVVPLPDKYDNNEYWVGSGWSDACAIIPYEMYLAYGDKERFISCIDMIEKWINYLLNHCDEHLIPHLPNNWGDWLALDRIPDNDWSGLTKYELINTAYFIYDLEILIKAKKLANQDVSKYDKLLRDVRSAYKKEFIKDGHMIGERALMYEDSNKERTCFTQTGIVLTLYFNLCDKNDKESLLNDLLILIKDSSNCFTTGFIGTPYLLKCLSENGQFDLACKLFLNKEYPSWLYSVLKGATTIWEHYDGIKENGDFWSPDMNSFNHYSYGSVFHWVFQYLVGIKIVSPGYEKIIISPHPVKELGFLNSTFSSKFGNIKVNWLYSDDSLKYVIEIPHGITAEIKIPGKESFTIKEKNKIEFEILNNN